MLNEFKWEYHDWNIDESKLSACPQSDLGLTLIARFPLPSALCPTLTLFRVFYYLSNIGGVVPVNLESYTNQKES